MEIATARRGPVGKLNIKVASVVPAICTPGGLSRELIARREYLMTLYVPSTEAHAVNDTLRMVNHPTVAELIPTMLSQRKRL